MKKLRFVVIVVFVASVGCATSSSSQSSQKEAEAESPPAADSFARPRRVWISERAARARQRLDESKAGRLVWQAIQAHGGLKRWYANGPLFFRYDYQPRGDGQQRDTYQFVDTWRARARHEMADNRDHEYGWDGEQAWHLPADWQPPHDARFWALTPYYFVGMPFVLADPGVRLAYEGTSRLEEIDYDTIRVTFGDVGVSPEDYYVVYLHPKTHRIAALRYIVSYPGFFPKGGHSPEKLMTYEGRQKIDGIIFAESYRFFMWDPAAKTDAEVVTNATLDSVAFRPDTPDSYFDVPDAAKVVAPPDGNTNDQ